MNLIEQANRRLEQLEQAGIDVPTSRLPESSEHPKSVQFGLDISAPPNQSERTSSKARSLKSGRRSVHNSSEFPSDRDSRIVDLDMVRLTENSCLTINDSRSDLAEEMRTIKRPIIDHASQARSSGKQRANLVFVTSALPGDGKTYCSINLAMSIAMEVDLSVLLVDADVVRPSILSRLGVDAELGMLDLLTDSTLDLQDVLIRTNIPKLTLLPAGRPTPKATELLASAAMEDLLSELAERYSDRIVIFDAPPLLLTSESRLLASRMGQVLMVVQANQTSRDAVVKALANIESCDVVWCVLNGAPHEHRSGGDDYYYSQYRSV
jgi:protein-tyrosine kinase